jgi:hypothetical protein
MWSGMLPLSLLWYATFSTYRLESYAAQPESYVAPSWSWASVSGGIDHDIFRTDQHLESLLTIDSIQCVLASEDPCGKICVVIFNFLVKPSRQS